METKAKRSVSFLIVLCLLVPVLSGTVLPALALGQETEEIASENTEDVYYFNYRHYYDEASFDASCRGYIDEAVAFADAVYAEALGYFGYEVSMQTTGTIMQDNVSGLSTCMLDADTPCRTNTCGTGAAHHKDILRISNSMYSNHTGSGESSNTFWVLWCDRERDAWCKYDQDLDMHLTYLASAVVVNSRPVIHIMSLDTSFDKTESHMAVLLAHETVHCMGMGDMYERHGDSDGMTCLMDYMITGDPMEIFYQQCHAGTRSPFCSQCMGDLLSTFETYWR